MNITHYIVGYAHYFCAATGYVCESPGFVRSSTSSSLSLSLSSISPVAWVLCLVFLAAWYYELDAHKIFANLKIQNSKSHSIPSGSLFKYVSCPHYLCEVIIYTCFMFILGLSHQTGVLGNKKKISKYFETNMILIHSLVLGVDKSDDCCYYEPQLVQNEVQRISCRKKSNYSFYLVNVHILYNESKF